MLVSCSLIALRGFVEERNLPVCYLAGRAGLHNIQMNPLESSQKLQVFTCAFEIHLQEATMTIKFPCTFTIELKSTNGKIIYAMTKNKVAAVNSVASFNEILKFEAELMLEGQSNQFRKKEILLNMSLISNRRPDQNKLVGRKAIDLAEIANEGRYATPHIYKLEYCSINAHVSFNAKYLSKKVSATPIDKFDHDSFTDYQSFISGLSVHRDRSNRSYDQEKTVEMGRKSRGDDNLEKNITLEEEAILPKQEAILPKEDRILPKQERFLSKQERFSPRQERVLPKEDRILSKEELDERIADVYKMQTSSKPGSPRYPIQRLSKEKKTRSIVTEPAAVNQQSQDKPSSLHGAKSFQSFESNKQHSAKYEEVLRNSHAQQRKMWEQENRRLQESIIKQKGEVSRLKEKSEHMQKKAHEAQMKMMSLESKMENSKRQNGILQRQKDIEVKGLENRVQRLERQLNETLQKLKNSQQELRQEKQLHKSSESKYQTKIEQIMGKKYEIEQKASESSIRIRQMQRENEKLAEEMGKKQREYIKKIQALQAQFEQVTQSYNEFRKKTDESLSKNEELLNKTSIERSQLASKLDAKQRENSDLNAKLGQLRETSQHQKDENNQKYLRLSQEHESLVMELDSLQNQKQVESEKYYKLQLEHEKLEKQFSNLKQEKLKLDQQHYEDKIAELQTTINQKDQSIHDLNQKVQDQHHMFQRNNKQLQDIIRTTTEEKDLLIQKSSKAEAMIDELEGQLKNIEALFDEKDEAINELSDELNKVNQAYDEKAKYHRQYVESLETELLSLYEKATEYEKEMNKYSARVEELEEGMKEMKAYEQGLEQDICTFHDKEYDKKISSLQVELEQRVQEINQLYREANEHKQYQFKLQQEILGLEEKVKQNENKEKERNENLAKAENVISGLRNQIASLEQEKQSLKIKNIEIKEKHLQEVDKIRINGKLEVEGLEAYIDELKAQNSAMEKQLRDNNQIIPEMEGQLEILKNKNRYLELQLKSSAENTPRFQIQDEDYLLLQQKLDKNQKVINGYDEILADKDKEIQLLQQQLMKLEANARNAQTAHKQNAEYTFNFIPEGSPRDYEQEPAHIRIHEVSSLKSSQEEQELEMENNHAFPPPKLNVDDVWEDDLSGGPSPGKYRLSLDSPKLRNKNSQKKELQDCKSEIAELKRYIESLEKDILEKQKIVSAQASNSSEVEQLKNYIKSLEKDILSKQKVPKATTDQNEIVQLKQYINSLEKDILEKEKASKNHDQTQISDLKEYIKSLEKEILEKQSFVKPDALYSEISQLKQYIKSLEKNILEKENQRVTPNEVAELKSYIKSLQQDILSKQKQIQQASSSSSQIAELKEYIKSLEKDILDKENQIKVANQNYDKVSQKQIENNSISEINADLNQKIRRLENQYNQLKRDKETQQKSFQQNIELLGKANKELEDNCTYYQEKIAAFKSKESNMEKTLKVIEQESQKIISELENKEIQIEKAQMELHSKEKIIESLNLKIDQLYREKDNVEETFNFDMEENMKQLNNSLDQMRREVQHRNEEIELLKEVVNSKKEENAQLKKNMADSERKLALLSKQMSDEQKIWEQQLKEENKKNFKLEAEIKSINDQLTTNKRLLNKMREKDPKTESSQLVISQLEGRIQSLEEQIFTFQANENQKDLRIDQLQKQILRLAAVMQNGNKSAAGSPKKQKQNSFIEVDRLRQEIQQLQAKNEQLEFENNTSKMEIEDLKYQLETIERMQPRGDPSVSQLRQEYDNKVRQLTQRNEESQQKIKQLQTKVVYVMEQNANLETQMENKQIEHMNNELDFQIRIRDKNDKSGLGSSANIRESRKSICMAPEIPLSEIMPASKLLRQILDERNEKDLTQEKISSLIGHIVELEDQLFSQQTQSKQKSLFIQSALSLQMEFSKLKAAIVKKAERMHLLEVTRSAQNSLKKILNYAESLREVNIDGSFQDLETN